MLRTFSQQRFFYNILFKAACEYTSENFILMNMCFVIISRSNTKVDRSVEHLATSLITSF